MTSLFELILKVPEVAVEAVCDALEALDAQSVTVEDADAMTPAEQALFGEPGMPPPKAGWQLSRVVALFATDAVAREAAEQWTAQFNPLAAGPTEMEALYRAAF